MKIYLLILVNIILLFQHNIIVSIKCSFETIEIEEGTKLNNYARDLMR